MDELTEYIYRQESKLQECEDKLSDLYVENLKKREGYIGKGYTNKNQNK